MATDDYTPNENVEANRLHLYVEYIELLAQRQQVVKDYVTQVDHLIADMKAWSTRIEQEQQARLRPLNARIEAIQTVLDGGAARS